jgi:CheY-like chemotaxis protein
MISLTGTLEQQDAVICIRDNGIGIAPDLLPRVFDLFVQADRSLDRAGGGLGVGLTLVRTLVEMHGGTVGAHSAGPGRGSEFVVRLPASVDLPASQAASQGRASGPVSSTLRVLVVDDNVDAAETLAMILTMGGHEVRTAHHGLAALDTARSFRPHAVLLDIGLPGMNGYEVASHLRQQQGMEKLLLVAVTGYGKPEDSRQAEEAGFDHHLTKPVDPGVLERLLTSWPRER